MKPHRIRTPAGCRQGLLICEEVRVDLDVLLPLVGNLVLGEARVDRAGLDAGVAVDALLGIDVELLDLVVVGLVRRRVDAIDRADLDARVVLGPDAGLRDHVGHGRFSTPVWLGTRDCTPLPDHGRAASSWAAKASSGPSCAGLPTSWIPNGRPSGWTARGSEIAGDPVTLEMAVNGVNAAPRANVAD